MLVIPGGADLPYVNDLSGDGTARIRKYVESGGKIQHSLKTKANRLTVIIGRYLGICAGGYFGASEVQFEKGTPLEVCGPRDLKFFPGVARGCVYPGFEYKSLRGSRGKILFFVSFMWIWADFYCSIIA